MKLVHRTNYWGREIIPCNSRQDSEIDMDLIWVQALEEDDEPPCCRGFGERSVTVDEQDFYHWDDDDWMLWLVSETRGRSESHYFYKFLLLPKGCRGKGKKSLLRRGFTHVADLDSRYLIHRLKSALDGYWQDNSDDINHVHIGVYTMDQSLFS